MQLSNSTEPAEYTEPATSPSDELLHMMRGFVVAKSLFVVARLGVADLLTEGPKDVDDIAAQTSTNPSALYRLLRALSSIDVFIEDEPGRFGLGRLGSGLLTAGPASVRNWLLVNGGPIFRSFEGMLSSVQTGKPAFPEVLGMSFFDYFEKHSKKEAEFDAAMNDITRRTAEAALHAYDFDGVGSVVDVGGGNGAFIAALLHAHPQMTGVLFDRPQVIENARHSGGMARLHDRCQFVDGDFFATVPGGADLYILSWVLHDWDDEHATTILRACRRAIPDGGRLLLIEAILPSDGGPHFAQFGDIVMLVALGGQERTVPEYRRLLTETGFRLHRIIPTGSPRSLIEAMPV